MAATAGCARNISPKVLTPLDLEEAIHLTPSSTNGAREAVHVFGTRTGHRCS
jgi:hypothetical protein